ncbi:MAG: Chaperone protein DnaK [Chthoniobacteraceae bacterium]|nr:Chaperone protein DnaK [Chthoniobacteraceae bacterium]
MSLETPHSPTSTARFVVGIDLGTTNSAVAYVDTEKGAIRTFTIPQLVAPGEIEARETLPSFHYEPAESEFSTLRLPWDTGQAAGHVVGVFARDHGAVVPGRLVVSAKSWLSHSGVDRTADLLPWHSGPGVRKISPGEASARYLGHIRAAWNHRWPDEPLEKQEVIITIPASFDEVARELTVAAARRAGLPRVVLLEEPQAAFYAWVEANGKEWGKKLHAGQTILVCDIGGGTSDFTLIEVRRGKGRQVRFHRVAVGNHLILGGDNLDLALAGFVENRLRENNPRLGQLEPRQWSVLVRHCQQAKETLLGNSAPERLTLSVPAAGSKLIGGALQIEITREEVATLLVDGFLPFTSFDEEPIKRSSGFQEFGLPYAADPAITRYLAAFLKKQGHTSGHGTAAAEENARPDVILLNGGLFESPLMRQRLLDVLGAWFDRPEHPWSPFILENQRLDLAVAYGAAQFGMVRRGAGSRISGGVARSYYIGVKKRNEETAAVCLVPAGLEEGETVDLLNQRFELLVRQPAEFPLYLSSVRTGDAPGAMVPVNPEEFSALPPIRTALRAKSEETGTVSVFLHARLTEIGTLEVWCSEADGTRKWRLQFDVRAATRNGIQPALTGREAVLIDEEAIKRCADLIQHTFSPGSPPALAESLVKRMEEITNAAGAGNRLDWSPALLRRFWDELLQAEPGRALSPIHEARWLNLLGFSLRPGYGVAVDDWRVAQTWRLATQERKVVHSRNELCGAEWWVLWRRIAGGLNAGQQKTLADPLIAQLKKSHSRLPWGSHETAEVWRMLGAFELLDASVKILLGGILLGQIKENMAASRAFLWTLGRFGARVPMYGPLNTVIPPEIVEKWVEEAAARRPDAAREELFFALTQMSRLTGDRYRDISEPIREWVIHAMRGAPERYLELIRTGGLLQEDEQNLAFGEALPHGLQVSA